MTKGRKSKRMPIDICLQLLSVSVVCSLMELAASEKGVNSQWSSSTRWDSDENLLNTIIGYPLQERPGLKRPVYLSQRAYDKFNTSLWKNVKCGGGYCPANSPICCGHHPYFYCVPGGMKCCDGPDGGAAACEQSAECCASRGNVSCCERGTTCLKDGNESSCQKEKCSKYETADECLHEDEGCAWCCAERRCISGGRLCSMSENPIKRGEVCSSPCEYVDTCSACLSGNNTENESNACLWCCSTQSCMSAHNPTGCENNQAVLTLTNCPACQANGLGINPQFVGTPEQFFAVLSVIVLIFGIMFSFGVGRAFLYYRRTAIMRNGMRVGDVEAQFAVRRHGFGASVPVPFQARVKVALKRIFRVMTLGFRLSLKRKGERGGTVWPIPHKSVLSCSACQRSLCVWMPSSVAKGIKDVDGLKGASAGNTNSEDLSVGDDVVILLPCSHLFCYSCIGLETNRENSKTVLDEAILEGQPRQDADAARETCFHLQAPLEREATVSGDTKTTIAQTCAPSREIEELDPICYMEKDGVTREVVSNKERGGNVDATTAGPTSRVTGWRDGLLSSFQQLRSNHKPSVSSERGDMAAVLLKKIKQSCPKCWRGVDDTLFLENVIHL